MLRAIQSLSDAVSCRLSSLAGFLASRTVAPGSGLRVQMIETFGASVGESLATYDPATHSLKMSQACLPLNLEGSSIESLATWPRCGMLVSGRLYQLPPLAHPTAENESGSSAEMNWATPNTLDSMPPKSPEAITKEATVTRPGRAQAANLRDQVSNMWPTATSRVHKDGTARSCENVDDNGLLGRVIHRYSGLPSPATGQADPVKRSTDGNRQELWATPDTAQRGHGPSQFNRNSPPLQSQVLDKKWTTPRAGNDTMCGGSGHKAMLKGTELEHGRGKLNPHWVMCLMGYPPLWAELGRKFQTDKIKKLKKQAQEMVNGLLQQSTIAQEASTPTVAETKTSHSSSCPEPSSDTKAEPERAGRKFTTVSRNSKAQATPSCLKSPPSSSTPSGGN